MSEPQNLQKKEEVKEIKGCGRLFKRLFLGSRLDYELIENITSGKLQEVKELLAKGASVNARNELGTTALMFACDFGYFDIVSLLINKNANVDDKNGLGFTALHYAVQKPDLRVVRLLVNLSEEELENRINRKDEKGNTPLHLAVEAGNIDVIDFLLKRKANKFIENNERRTPLDIAKRKQFVKIVSLLEN